MKRSREEASTALVSTVAENVVNLIVFSAEISGKDRLEVFANARLRIAEQMDDKFYYDFVRAALLRFDRSPSKNELEKIKEGVLRRLDQRIESNDDPFIGLPTS